ncbi:MAG: hypothetical protein KDI01_03255 [Halioglobus sp.]|nr:hypothetical protein [Halioglobus sp.]
MGHKAVTKVDAVLIILGTVGLVSVVVSAYVFTVAARNYVSAEERRRTLNWSANPRGEHRMARNPNDRRSGRPVVFPLTVDGVVVACDRRSGKERRRGVH